MGNNGNTENLRQLDDETDPSFVEIHFAREEEIEEEPNTEKCNHNNNNNTDCTLDAILVRIGQFGKYQIYNYTLLCLPMIFNAFFSISYVFTASTVVHRCNVTQCDSAASLYMEDWVAYTIPTSSSGDMLQCSRYVAINGGDGSGGGGNDARFAIMQPGTVRTAPSTAYCYSENFNSSATENCGTDFKFRDNEFTISNDFGIYCSDQWKLSLVGTINNIGQFVGIPLGGFLADRYGRRTMLAIGGSLSALMGIIRSLSPGYTMFVIFEFIDMAVGSTLFPTAFLLALELVGPQRRVAAATIITIFYALGEALLAVLAQAFQNWRTLLLVLYTPASLQLLFLWLLPESVRWLLSQGQEERATKVLRKAAAVNNRALPEEDLEQLVQVNRAKLTTEQTKATNADATPQYPILQAIRMFVWRLLNFCLCWFTHTLVALGLSLNSVNLGGNKYVNFMLNGLVQVPGLILPLIIMDRIGRRYSLCGSMLVCAICMVASMLVPKDNYPLELTLFLIGKLAITCSFQVLYFFTSELFPTSVRNSLLSLCSMVGRIGSMLAPLTPLLANHYEYAPQLLFGSFALISGFLTLLFPETANKVLPTTIDEAHHLGNDDNFSLNNELELT